MKSAIRRHRYNRLKKKRLKYWGYGSKFSGQMTPKQIGMVVATPHPCSRICCGNPRKYFNELTIQEQRNMQEDN